MFSSRLKSSEKILDYIAIYDVAKPDERAVLEWHYPSNSVNDELFPKLPEFLLPCPHRSAVSEQYTLLFTDIKGKFDFVICLLLPLSGYAVCIKSVHPWFELFHSLLALISQEQMYATSKRSNLIGLLENLTHKDGLFYFDVSSEDRLAKFCSPVPDEHDHPFYHRYILEYYNTLSFNNWIFIFEFMLLEKSVIFYSRRLHRITSCILASLSLLYPLTWVHLVYPLLPVSCIDYVGCPSPFIAGIHSCMLEDVRRLVSPGVLLVDLDANSLFSVGAVNAKLPDILRSWLTTRCERNPPDFTHHEAPTKYIPNRAAATLVKPYLEIMTILLGGYRQAMVYCDSHVGVTYSSINRPSGAHSLLQIPPNRSAQSSTKWYFDHCLFVDSRGNLCQAYLENLLQSQMVVEFVESRLAILNSDLGMIPQDDFEDLLSRMPYASRSHLSQIILKGRDRLDRLVKKLNKRKPLSMDKVKQMGSVIKGAFINNTSLEEVNISKPSGATPSLPPVIHDNGLPINAAEENDASDSGDDVFDEENDTNDHTMDWSVMPPSETSHKTVRVERLIDYTTDTFPIGNWLTLPEQPNTSADSHPDLLSFTDSPSVDRNIGHNDLLREIFSSLPTSAKQNWERRIPASERGSKSTSPSPDVYAVKTNSSSDLRSIPRNLPTASKETCEQTRVKIDLSFHFSPLTPFRS